MRTGAAAFVLVAVLATAQDKARFDPSRDLEGFDRAAASERRDLYSVRTYLDKSGQEMTAEELAKVREQWKSDREAAEKRIEAILADPREAYLYDLERRLALHPYFSKSAFDVDRSVEGSFFLVQRPRPGANVTQDPHRIAGFYGPPMTRMAQTFEDEFVRPLGLARRRDLPAYAVCLLTDEDEYHAFGETIEQVWRLSEACYDPKLGLIVAYGDPYAPATTPARQRRLVLSEFARALQHAHYSGRTDRPTSLWLNLGFASWFGWREGVLAEAQDKTAVDPDVLADLVRISQDTGRREILLHPLLDLLQVTATSDIVLLAKNRAEAAGAKEPPIEAALRAFYDQAFLWTRYLCGGPDGRHHEAFLKFFQSALNGVGGLDAFYLAFRGVDLARLDKDFYSDLYAEHERALPKVKLDRAWSPASRTPGAASAPVAPLPPGAPTLPPRAPFAPSAVAVGPADVDGQHGLALLAAIHGDLDGALRTLEELAPRATEPPSSQRIAREIERVKQFRLLRDGYFDYLVRTGEKVSGKYRGMDYVASVQKVEDGWLHLGENTNGLSKIPITALEPFEIARQAGRKEEQGQAEPWVRFWPYILVGEKKWEQLFKDDSEPARLLREDAKTAYPEVLSCAQAAVALNSIAATPEPRNAKDAEKLLASVKSLLAEHGDSPLVQRKTEALRAAVGSVLPLAYPEQDPSKQCHGTWTSLGNGLANLVYEFAKPEEAQDFRRVPGYLDDYHKSVAPTAKKEEDSSWSVAGGEFVGSGMACYRHFAEFTAPISLRYDLVFRNAPVKGAGAGAFTFMVGACDDGKGSYVACLNFGELTITDISEHAFKTLSDDKPALSKKVFKLELKHDGKSVSTWLNGQKKFETPCGSLKSGSVFLWFHTDNTVAIQRLEIDGKLDPTWPERAKAAFFQEKLAEIGFR